MYNRSALRSANPLASSLKQARICTISAKEVTTRIESTLRISTILPFCVHPLPLAIPNSKRHLQCNALLYFQRCVTCKHIYSIIIINSQSALCTDAMKQWIADMLVVEPKIMVTGGRGDSAFDRPTFLTVRQIYIKALHAATSDHVIILVPDESRW